MSYYGDDDYDYEYESARRHHRRPSFDSRRATSSTYLDPGAFRGGGGLHRTKSTGHSPAPVVNIYNDQVQDHYSRQDTYSRSGSPRYAPAPPQMPMAPPPQMQPMPIGVPVPYPVVQQQPEYRGRAHSRGRLGDDLVEEMAEMALRDQLRSRSRGRSDAGAIERADFYEWQLQEERRKQDEARRRAAWDAEAELKRMKEAAKRKADQEEEDAERKHMIAEYEEKKRKEAEKAKEEEKRIREKVEREKQEAKEKEEREWNEFLRKQKEKEEKEKAAKKAEKEKMENEMRRRLENFGYTQEQIDLMVDEEKAKKYKAEHKSGGTTTTTTSLEVWRSHHAPTYAKIHKDYLSVETLLYYDIPYEHDKKNPDYIIILREMDKYETEVLFEHTKRLRSKKLLLEAPKDKPQYAWYRKRDRSTSRVRKVGILEFK